MLRESITELMQGATNHLFNRQPLALEMHAALLQPRHREQVIDQLLHGLRLPTDLAQHVSPHALGHMALSHLGRAENRRQRCAQIVRDRREQGVAHALAFHRHLGLLRHVDEMHALQRQRDLACAGLQQAPLLGHIEPTRRTQFERQHAPWSHRREQRHIQRSRCGERVRALPCQLRVLHAPAREAHIHLHGTARCGQQTLVQIGQQQTGLGIEHARHRAERDLRNLLLHQRARKIARQPRQGTGSALALRRHFRLVPQPRHQLPADQRHPEHQAEGEQILRVVHAERGARWNEKIIKTSNRQQRRPGPRPASPAQRRQHDHQQKQHDHVGGVEDLQQ